jgi:hypothetical protein
LDVDDEVLGSESVNLSQQRVFAQRHHCPDGRSTVEVQEVQATGDLRAV